MKSLALFVITVLLCTVSWSQDKQRQTTYVWYDSEKPQQLWLDESVIVEFLPRSIAGTAGAMLSGGVRVWRQQELAAVQGQVQGMLSPVMRDGPQGAMRALPGNVIVRLNPAWSSEQISAWLRENGLVQLRRLPVAGNAVVVESPPGLASLELANRLHESGTVVSAQPNWWVQMQLR